MFTRCFDSQNSSVSIRMNIMTESPETKFDQERYKKITTIFNQGYSIGYIWRTLGLSKDNPAHEMLFDKLVEEFMQGKVGYGRTVLDVPETTDNDESSLEG